MEGARKRAAAACDRCRRRKRRCDGGVPNCHVCQKSGVECKYTENDSRRSGQTSNEVNERLHNLELLIEEQASYIEDLKATQHQQFQLTQQSPVQFVGSNTSPADLANVLGQRHHEAPISQATPSLSFDIEAPPMLIPRGHSTTTESLLASEHVQSLLGQFPNGMFLIKEAKRGWPTRVTSPTANIFMEDLPHLDRSSTRHLVDAYFSSAHAECPILDQSHFYGLYERVVRSGPQHDADSALCLVVLAIGSVVTQPVDDILGHQRAGLEYITGALRILVPDAFYSFGSNVTIPQALLLASKYYGYSLRPLQSWKLVTMASTSIQHLCSVAFGPKGDAQLTAAISLTAWAVFDTECDLIAEHQLPHSGIEHVIENMPFPTFEDQSDETLLFLAELSVRKLLNRVHHVLYDSSAPTSFHRLAAASPSGQMSHELSIPQVLSVSRELDRQLETWFQMLPQSIRPDLHDSSSCEMYQLCSLLRYHSAKDIIFRPFVMYACGLPLGEYLPALIIEQCEVCIQHCRSYIHCAASRLEMSCSNREILLHSVLASTIVLTIAALCPTLEHLVLDIDTMQTKSVDVVKRWAVTSSLVEDIAEILRLSQAKTRLLKP